MEKNFSLQNPVVVILLFLIAVFGIYTSTLHAPMIFDDLELLVHNPAVISPASGFLNPGKDFSRKRLTLATFALNYYFHAWRTFGYHLVNTLLHLLAGIFLWQALLQLFQAPWFRQQGGMKSSEPFAVFVTLMFLVHPLQTQAVSYIWQRSEILTGMFYALVLWCYWKGRVSKNIRFVIYSGLFCFIGLYAKGPVVSAPLLLALSEIFFFGAAARVKQRGWRKNILTAVFGMAFIAAAFFAVLFVLGASLKLSLVYFLTQLLAVGKYLQLTFIPAGQSLEHGYRWIRNFWRPEIIASAGAFLALLSGCMVLAKRFRLAMFGVFWYFIYLLPTSSIFLISTPIFEHRLYFSIPGFGIFIAALIFGGLKHHRRWRNGVAVGLIAVFAVTAFFRNLVWRSDIILLEDTIRKYPERSRPYWTLAGSYMRDGRWKEAEKVLRKAIELAPDFSGPYSALGVVLMETGRGKDAIRVFHRAMQLEPNDVSPYWCLAHYYKKRGLLDLALKYITKALKISDDSRGLAEAGDIFMRTGRLRQAEQVLRRGAAADGRNFRVRYLLAKSLFLNGKYDEAEANFRWCLSRDYNFGPAFYGIGMIALRRNNLPLAKEALERACQLEKGIPYFYTGLAEVYARMGERRKAAFYWDLSRKLLLPHNKSLPCR